MTMTDRRAVRSLALRYCYESQMFDNAREVDANPNHPIVRAAWERAKAELGNDGEPVEK